MRSDLHFGDLIQLSFRVGIDVTDDNNLESPPPSRPVVVLFFIDLALCSADLHAFLFSEGAVDPRLHVEVLRMEHQVPPE